MSQVRFPRPDWMMFGVDNADGTVMLLASQEMTYAELEAVYEWMPLNLYGSSHRSISGVSYTRVSAQVASFTVVTAPDYPEAFRRLFQSWKPEAQYRAEIAPMRKELR